jgi:hypothetical protein
VYRALCFLADPRAHPLCDSDDDEEDTDVRVRVMNQLRLGAFMDMSSSDVLLLVATVAGAIVATRWDTTCRHVDMVQQHATVKLAGARLRAERIQVLCDRSRYVLRAMAQALITPLVTACAERCEPLGLLRLCARAKVVQYDSVDEDVRARYYTELHPVRLAWERTPVLRDGDWVVIMPVTDALLLHRDIGLEVGTTVRGRVYASATELGQWLLKHPDEIAERCVTRVLLPRVKRVVEGMADVDFDPEYLPVQLGKECGARVLEWMRVHTMECAPADDWEQHVERAAVFAVDKFGLDATNMHKVVKMVYGRPTCIVNLPKNHGCVCSKLHSKGDLYLMAGVPEAGKNVRVSLRTWASGTHKEPYLGMIVVPAQGEPTFYPVTASRVFEKRKR